MKNYFYIFSWIIYFFISLDHKYDYLLIYLNKISIYSLEIKSYINAFFAILISIWILSMLDNSIDKILKQNKENYLILTLDKVLSIFKYLISLYVWLYLIILPKNIDIIINKFFYIIVLFVLLYIFTDLLNIFLKSEFTKNSKFKNLNKHIFPFFNKLIIVSIWIIWIVIIISNLWYDVSALVTWAWIWWIAIALSAQKSLINIFWAITILLNKPFKIWDTIILNTTTWTVKDIWLTYLTLIDKQWHQVMIPNESILSWKVENLSIRKYRKVEFSIWLDEKTSIEKVKNWVKMIESILQKYIEMKTILEYRVSFNFLFDISIEYQSTLITDYNAYLRQKEDLELEIKKEFSKSRISISSYNKESLMK